MVQTRRSGFPECEVFLPNHEYGNGNFDSIGEEDKEIALEEIVSNLDSKDVNVQLDATVAVREMLRGTEPPIDIIINAGVLPKLVQFLTRHENSHLQSEAAWALANIAAGNSLQTRAVVESGAAPVFILMFTSPNITAVEHAVLALGNIAGDGPEFRDYVINLGILPHLLPLTETEHLQLLKTVVWTLRNLCRGKTPPPPNKVAELSMPCLARLLQNNNIDILSDTCYAISALADGPNDKIEGVIKAGVVPRLIQLLEHEDSTVVTPALQALGNIVTGNDLQTQVVLDAGALPHFGRLLKESKLNLQKEAAWTISNITAGSSSQIQAVIDGQILPSLLEAISKDDEKVQKEAIWAITNLTCGGTPEQIARLITEGILSPYSRLLSSQDLKIVQLVLNGLNNILDVADRCHKLEQVFMMIDECDGLCAVTRLLCHENSEIALLAHQLVEKCYNGLELISWHRKKIEVLHYISLQLMTFFHLD